MDALIILVFVVGGIAFLAYGFYALIETILFGIFYHTDADFRKKAHRNFRRWRW